MTDEEKKMTAPAVQPAEAVSPQVKPTEESAQQSKQEPAQATVKAETVTQPAKAKQKAEEIEMICLPAHPPKKKPKEDVAKARTIANRYLSVAALEKIVNGKKARAKKKAEEKKARGPETPEEFYDVAHKYAVGAECAVSFGEKAIYYRKAAERFLNAGNYLDAEERCKQCGELAERLTKEGYESAYREAVALREKAVTEEDWFKAARAFERIPEYRDAAKQGRECEQRLARISGAKRPLKLVVAVLIIVLLVGGFRLVQTKPAQYQIASTAHSMGFDSAASTLLESLGEYRDSAELLNQINYAKGVEKLQNGSYSNAKKYFKLCKDYQDTNTLLAECNYQLGVKAMSKEKWKTAFKRFTEAGDFNDAQKQLFTAECKLIALAELGDKVSYGGNEYVVLDHQDGQTLLLSVKLYGEVPYHTERKAVSWKDSTMRAELNSQTYLDNHFSAEEQSIICAVETDKDCIDRVFLLSLEQYEKYLPVMGEKKAIWWLRDNGEQPDTALFVSQSGAVMSAGYPVNTTDIQGRAALWLDSVKLDSVKE